MSTEASGTRHQAPGTRHRLRVRRREQCSTPSHSCHFDRAERVEKSASPVPWCLIERPSSVIRLAGDAGCRLLSVGYHFRSIAAQMVIKPTTVPRTVVPPGGRLSLVTGDWSLVTRISVTCHLSLVTCHLPALLVASGGRTLQARSAPTARWAVAGRAGELCSQAQAMPFGGFAPTGRRCGGGLPLSRRWRGRWARPRQTCRR